MVSMEFHLSKRLVLLTTVLAAVLDVNPTRAQSRYKDQSRRINYITDYSDEGDPFIFRVKINPFELVLSPTPAALGEAEEDDILTAVQDIVDRYAEEQDLPEGTSFQYMVLANVVENQFVEGNTGGRDLESTDPQTVLLVDGGMASFLVEPGNDPPVVSQVSHWVETAVDRELVPALENTPLNFIQTTEIESLTYAPTPSPTTLQIAGEMVREEYIQEEKLNTGTIAGAVVGSVVVLGLVASVLLLRRRKQVRDTPAKSDDDEEESCEIDVRPIDAVQEGTPYYENPLASVDARYADNDSAASISEWTASSSFTSRTTDTRPSFGASIGQTESFELDRQVMLHKDMLYTSPGWSDAERAPNGTEETVLKPSYFPAKQECHGRHKGGNKDPPDSTWNPNESANDSKGSPNADSLFLFEANDNGEEVYLMPPNQTSRRRLS